jgi:hypothetical protein
MLKVRLAVVNLPVITKPMTKAKPGFYKGCDIGKSMGNECR